MIKTPICDLLGIEYPIFQGGMAWISDGKLAAAVSNGGGLGIISAMNANAEYLKKQIDLARSLTDKPFGVNIMLMSPFAEEVAQLVAQEKVAVVTTGAGNPSRYMPMWLEAGIKVIPVVASVGMAKLVTKAGAAAIIAEGGESGGHVGDLTTMVLVPQVCDATPLPVLAAGGIGDGRGVAAAFMLGAQGVQVGTRFLVAEECGVHPNYKKKVLKANDIATMVTASGWAIRCGRSRTSSPRITLRPSTARSPTRSWRSWAAAPVPGRRGGRRENRRLPGRADFRHDQQRAAAAESSKRCSKRRRKC